MTDAEKLRAMIDELRRQRNRCEPKTNRNPRYLKYCTAVSSLLWLIDDPTAEEAASSW